MTARAIRVPRAVLAAVVVLTAPAGALALAGCGGDRLSHGQYERQVRSAYGAVQDAFRQTRVRSLGALEPRLAAAQAELRDAAEALEAREPPRDVEEHNEELVEGLRGYADELDGLRRAARDGDRAFVAAFNARIAQDERVERIAESLEEIIHRGYDLGVKPD
jgi:hypothetical protein